MGLHFDIVTFNNTSSVAACIPSRVRRPFSYFQASQYICGKTRLPVICTRDLCHEKMKAALLLLLMVGTAVAIPLIKDDRGVERSQLTDCAVGLAAHLAAMKTRNTVDRAELPEQG